MYVPMPITDIELLLRHGILYKKLVTSVTKMLDHYNYNSFYITIRFHKTEILLQISMLMAILNRLMIYVGYTTQ